PGAGAGPAAAADGGAGGEDGGRGAAARQPAAVREDQVPPGAAGAEGRRRAPKPEQNGSWARRLCGREVQWEVRAGAQPVQGVRGPGARPEVRGDVPDRPGSPHRLQDSFGFKGWSHICLFLHLISS
ncbi:unnamed protein product, partial [Heterosigma akashiwo]